ncbi:zinc finger protein 271-like [Leptidea sinapis]|uniref:zinc finger protein 271-like n=1 Tax=Leptidea sinapis TaxID=189913 RepID=UPI0021C39B4D|nr:zinc finger protein 271-like [Leptidea sinapis]
MVDAADGNNSNWMRFINCSRHWSEHNLVAFQYKGELYYCTIRTIPRNTELMVYYGSEFAHRLHVDIGRYNSPVDEFVKRLAASYEHYDKMYAELTNPRNKSGTSLKQSVIFTKKKKIIPVKKSNSSNVKRPTYNQTIASKKTNKIHSDTKSTVSIVNEKTNQSVELKEHNSIYRDKKSQSDNITKTTPNEPDASKVHNTCGMTESSNVGGTMSNQCSYLKQGTGQYTGEKPYPRDECGKSTTESGHLTNHKRIQPCDKPYPCNVCGKSFNQSSHLKTHSKIHTGDKSYPCNVCGKSFIQSSDLKRHSRIHTGDKPYPCNVCGKSFSESGHLKRHSRIHTGDKPYTCDICPLKFTHKQSLVMHFQKRML